MAKNNKTKVTDKIKLPKKVLKMLKEKAKKTKKRE